MIRFNLEIKKKRLELKETQEQFGKRFGVSHASVSEWETGKTEAPYKVLQFCHNCESDWREGYMRGVEQMTRDNDKYYKIGRAIADLIHEITDKEDY